MRSTKSSRCCGCCCPSPRPGDPHERSGARVGADPVQPAVQRGQPRLRVLLTGIIDGYRRGGADHGDLISILMRARDDDTGAGMTGKQLRDEATTLVIAGSGDDGEHHRLGLLPARPAPGDPRTAPGRSRPRAGRPRCQLPGPGQAALHQRRDHPGAAPGQPGLDTAPPGARRCRARRPPAPGRKQDLRQPGRAQPRRAAAPRPRPLRARPAGHRLQQERYAGNLLPVRPRHQEPHRRRIRLDRINPCCSARSPPAGSHGSTTAPPCTPRSAAP